MSLYHALFLFFNITFLQFLLAPYLTWEIDEQHDVTVLDVGRDIHPLCRGNDLGHELVHLVHTEAADNLRETLRRARPWDCGGVGRIQET